MSTRSTDGTFKSLPACTGCSACLLIFNFAWSGWVEEWQRWCEWVNVSSGAWPLLKPTFFFFFFFYCCIYKSPSARQAIHSVHLAPFFQTAVQTAPRPREQTLTAPQKTCAPNRQATMGVWVSLHPSLLLQMLSPAFTQPPTHPLTQSLSQSPPWPS